MNQHNKETIQAWAILIGAVLLGVLIGYLQWGSTSLNELEERMEALQLQAYEVNQACIAELETTHRLLQREANRTVEPTNGV